MTFLPNHLKKLPDELMLMILLTLPDDCFFVFIYTYFVESEFCFRMICEKLNQVKMTYSNSVKATKEACATTESLIKIGSYMIFNKEVRRSLDNFADEEGTCYLDLLRFSETMVTCRFMIGHYPSPWLTHRLYNAESGYGLLPSCRNSGCGVRSEDGRITWFCIRCQINDWFIVKIWPNARSPKTLLFRFLKDDVLNLHLCKYNHHPSMNSNSQRRAEEEFGEGEYVTMRRLTQWEAYFDGKVGTPEVIPYEPSEDEDEIKTEIASLKLKLTKKRAMKARVKDEIDDDESMITSNTVKPMESASNVTPRPLQPIKPKIQKFDISELSSVVNSMIESRMADLKTEPHTLSLKKTVGDYTRFEYDEDLEEAFQSCGVVVREGQTFLKPMAHTRASELIPKMTIDDRLNFLIRIHTAIFKVVKDTRDYPRPGITEDLRRATEGELPDDHPSFDLLQIVLTDTIDWSHMIVKSNNFLLPVLEQGMRFNERILAVCLLSLMGEYFARWTSVMKDCILPTQITDTSKWSDSYSMKSNRQISAKRPDMAVEHRQSSRKYYSRKRRDSILS
jgi:hypothetical protein